MKRGILFTVLIITFFITRAQPITWDGGGADGMWNTATNWVGDVIPGSTADVLLDNSIVAGTYTVNLPSGAVNVTLNSLTITPSGVNIIVILPTSNTSPTALQINGSGDAFVLNNWAVFINSSGAISGTPVSVTATNTFRINNGGHYIHNTQRGHTNNLAARLSTVAGTENGIFQFDVPVAGNYLVSASGRTYGRLVFSSFSSSGTRSYSSTGISLLTINGNLEILFSASFTFGITNNILVKGDLIIDAGCSIDISSGSNNTVLGIEDNLTINGTITESGTGFPEIQLNGTINQNITSSGSISNSVDFNLNNSAGATLLTNLVLPLRLTLTSGNLTLGTNTLTTPSVNGGTTISHIITNSTGFLKITSVAAGPVNFPIGPTATSYNPIVIQNGGSVDYSIRVETGINPAIANPLEAIDRTWNIYTSVIPASAPTITFQYAGSHAQPLCIPTANMDVGKFVSGVWNVVAPNITPVGSDPYTVTTSAITSFNAPFVVGNVGAFLPLDYFITCRAQKSSGNGYISWTIQDAGNVNTFEVQRSVNSGGFQTIANLSPVNNQLDYQYTDHNLSKGTSLYRIRVNRLSGGIRYSNTVALIHESSDIRITSINPNPVQATATLTVSAAKPGGLFFIVYDISGKEVRKWHSNIDEGNNYLSVDLGNLPAGAYHILASTPETRTVLRFIKQ